MFPMGIGFGSFYMTPPFRDRAMQPGELGSDYKRRGRHSDSSSSVIEGKSRIFYLPLHVRSVLFDNGRLELAGIRIVCNTNVIHTIPPLLGILCQESFQRCSFLRRMVRTISHNLPVRCVVFRVRVQVLPSFTVTTSR